MTEKPKIRLVVDEDADIVARIDELAETEGTSRAAIVRRFIRRQLFSLPIVPTFENCSEVTSTPAN